MQDRNNLKDQHDDDISSSTASSIPKMSSIDSSRLYDTKHAGFVFGRGYKPGKRKPKPIIDDNDSNEYGPLLYNPTLGYYYEVNRSSTDQKKIVNDDIGATTNTNITIHAVDDRFFGCNKNYEGSLKKIPADSILNAPVAVEDDGTMVVAMPSSEKKSNIT